MKKKKEPKFTYKDNYTKCEVIDYKYGRKYVGEAYCHPDDSDFQSLITGSTIAEMRAIINTMITYKNDLRIKLEALSQLYYSMNQSKKFNKESYEAKMLFRQMNLLKQDLAVAKEQIEAYKKDLNMYMKDKDNVYKYLRKKKNNK